MRDLDYTHKDQKRANNPSVGLAGDSEPAIHAYAAPTTAAPPPPITYDYHDKPTIQWKGKRDSDKVQVETVPLHVHESIHPATMLEPAISDAQSVLDDFFGPQRPRSEAVQFYEHEDGWTNRLISGDSLLVMNSLLQKEPLVAGRVQMIYYDPPYGINFNSNFQPSVFGGSGQMEISPEPITAFRDT